MANGDIDVQYVADLARLELSETEVPTFQREIAAILDHVRQLEAVDVDGVDPTAHATAIHNVWRNDVAGETLDHDTAMANAPAVDGDLIKVPVVIGDDIAGGA